MSLLQRIIRQFVGVTSILLCAVMSAAYALTPVDTLIRNQAAATYTDDTGTSRSITSNDVETRIQQVAAVTLTQDQTRLGASDSQVSFPHTVTNTGNGEDTFNLTFTDQTADYTFTSVQAFPDEDGNGIADSATAITATPELGVNESYSFLLVVTLPTGLTAGDQNQVLIEAESAFDTNVDATNTDTVTVTDRAIVEVTKSLSESQGVAGSGPYRVNVTYINTSGAIANDVTLIDVLPTDMVYAGNATWSIGNFSLTDNSEANQQQNATAPIIQFCAYNTACSTSPFAGDRVVAVIEEVGAGQSATISFDVTISNSALPQTLLNRIEYFYNDGFSVTASVNSNDAPFTIAPTADVDLVGFTAPDAFPGNTVNFDNTITNNGNGDDTFNITLDSITQTFPSGTAFSLFNADGFTPLTDTNGDGVSDTGVLAPGESTIVVLRATLPANAAAGTYFIDKTAQSLNDINVTDTDRDTVTVLNAALPVDVTNNAPRGDAACDEVSDNCGFGAGAEATAQTTLTVPPANTAVFSLFITNNTTNADTYDLAASTDASFSTLVLPSGWSVLFQEASSGTTLSNIVVPAGASVEVNALVSTTSQSPPTTSSLFFRAISTISGAQDVKHDAVEVEENTLLQLAPDQVGQNSPGSFITYTHLLQNTGNTTETNIALSVVNSLPGWSVNVYEDTNDDGVWDGADQLVTNIASLAPGDEEVLFVRIFTPTNAAAGVQNTSTLTATYNGGADTLEVFDITTSNPFNVDLLKQQALDAGCDGTPDTAFTSGNFSASPGQCIVYSLLATNASTEPVVNVEFIDATPGFTVYATTQPTPRCTPAVCTFVEEPAIGSTGAIRATAGNLAAGNSIELLFSVELEQ